MIRFDPPSKFSLRNAFILAHLSRRIYDLDAGCAGRGVTWIENRRTDTQAMVVRRDSDIIVAMRGTEPGRIRDIVTDAECALVPGMFGYGYHAGFWRAYRSIAVRLLDAVTDARDNDQHIWIGGHSMGAGLATIFCDILSRYVPVAGLYTFGSPRVGDFDFHRSFNARFFRAWRVVNSADVVSRVPTQFMGYSHVGKLFYIDAAGAVHDGSDLSWWAGFWDRLKSRGSALLDLRLAAIADHAAERYESAIAAAYRAEIDKKLKFVAPEPYHIKLGTWV